MAYKTVYRTGCGEYEAKKSRFIGVLAPASTEAEALDAIAAERKKYRDARHHCYAYVLGVHGETTKSSDDGEPSGTAGRPILELMSNEGIRDAVLVVTRYFGGTLLGTGGLVRAYQAAAKAAIDNALLVEKRLGRKLAIITDYADLGRIASLAATSGMPVCATHYLESVTTEIVAPVEAVDGFVRELADATGGRARVCVGDVIGYALADGKIITYE